MYAGIEHDLHEIRFARMKTTEPGRPIAQRRNCCDQWTDANLSSSHQFHRFWIFTARGTRSLQTYLTRNNLLQRQIYLWSNVADQRYRAAFSHAINCRGDRLVSAHGL